jgi:methylglutaconyl-CoA hydratase
MENDAVLWNLDARGIATVTLNRPGVNNAYNADLVNGVLAAMDTLGGAAGLRLVVVCGAGKHFQAGADLEWLRSVSERSHADNVTFSEQRRRSSID